MYDMICGWWDEVFWRQAALQQTLRTKNSIWKYQPLDLGSTSTQCCCIIIYMDICPVSQVQITSFPWTHLRPHLVLK